MADDLLGIADELYAAPLGDFTANRDRIVKQHKGSDLATQVKALRKPSLAAWVLNLFVRREGDQVTQVLAVGESLRAAQAGMSAADLRQLTRQRRQLTAAVTQQARSLARDEGVRVTEAVATQVENMLTSAMVDERCGQALRSGLLTGTLTTTGVGHVDDADLAAVVAVPEAIGFTATARQAPEPEPPDLRVVPDPDADAKARAAAEQRVGEAEAVVAEAEAAHEEATGAVEELRARQLQIEADIDELNRRIAELEETRDGVDDELDEAEQTAAETEETLTGSRHDLDAARAALDRLAREDSP